MILPTQNTSNSHTIFALTNVTIWVQKENFLKNCVMQDRIWGFFLAISEEKYFQQKIYYKYKTHFLSQKIIINNKYYY